MPPQLGGKTRDGAVHSETAATAEEVRQVTCIQRRGGDAEAQTVGEEVVVPSPKASVRGKL